MITAPYNFVPLSDKVVMPFWANHVSHDIPFQDAQSGTLHVKITAKSPIYVRNGMPRNAKEDDQHRNDFNNMNGDCFIPGSSLKGMIRSMVEIMSFGRMKNKVNDHKYSVRDFQNNKIYNKTEISNKADCGWLYKKGDTFYLDDCGKAGRISHKNLDVLCGGQKISDYYKRAENVARDSQKSAKAKYELFDFIKTGHHFSKDREDMGRVIYKIDENEGKKGTIVMSGQSSVRNEPKEGKASGKHLEFVFFQAKKEGVEVPEEIINNFFFAYYDHDKNQQKEDWKWRKKQLEAGEKIPVFFRKKNDGSIKDMGLTLLYKITYDNSVVDLINHQQKDSSGYDLAETIFGYAEDKRALKGRVHFGHAFVSHQVKTLPLELQVLAGPKASYYPNYIEQDADENGKLKNDYKTYMDNNTTIRGWKRYPVRNNGTTSYPLPRRGDGTINFDVVTKFIPLPAGTEFSFDISYHNLRKEELGALISALTFHNTQGLYHSIGSAKPLGYGKIQVEIENLEEAKKMEFLKAYELFMDASLGHSTPLWFQLPQIKELFAMAKPGEDDEKLKYMALTDFVNAKGRRKDDPRFSLPMYSKISINAIIATSLITLKELNETKICYQKEKETLENQEDISAIKERLLSLKKKELKDAIQKKKEELLNKLEEQKRKLKEKEIGQKELGSGINLNGVLERNTVDALMRTLKRWKNELNGSIREEEIQKIKTRFDEIFTPLKEKDKAKWVQNLQRNIPKLNEYLNQSQLEEVQNFVNRLFKEE